MRSAWLCRLSTAIFLVLLGAAVGVLANTLAPADKCVSYFHFNKTGILMETLSTSVAVGKASLAQESAGPGNKGAVEVTIFVSGECEECAFIKEQVIPRLRNMYGDRIDLRIHDTDDFENYKRLVEYENRYGSKEDVTSKMFVKDRYLAGASDIAGSAVSLLKEVLAQDSDVSG